MGDDATHRAPAASAEPAGPDDGAAPAAPVPPVATTTRSRAKAARRAALLTQAARLFARRGFDGVSIEDLGAAAGVSGPAVYRHFAGKQAVLAALLVDVSAGLLAGGREVVARAGTDTAALHALVRFHVDFALTHADVIRVQDHDLDALAEHDRRTVRGLQRRYVELWVDVLTRLDPHADPADLRLRAHATFGLLNSTPHSAGTLPPARVGALLADMALAGLGHPARTSARTG
jgi:AcrR family transcriptional regulator